MRLFLFGLLCWQTLVPDLRLKSTARENLMKTFAEAHAAGVKIAFGTDSGVSPHGDNAREFELMVAGGMTPMQAIQAATLEASKLLRIEDKLGTLEAGKIADIVAVKGDPIENISLMKKVAFVMKEGTVYKNE